ncbi:9115_t:CDS:2 [Acaulospora colombiana]|uniref:9115_t:CDS:1 n=1 Tax=Acaulospora colombiana TaxID=27376 RepID=A0ACA9KDX0_9GLOM|nr:9115_t:CDS:2 [Acaulospora colombiana]
MSSLVEWLENARNTNDINLVNFIEFNELKRAPRRIKLSRPNVFMKRMPEVEIVLYELNEYYDVMVEEEIKLFSSMSADQGDLDEYLEKMNLGWNEKIDLAIGLVNALEFLHNNNIVHAYLNPKNILFKQGILKLTNFGKLDIFKMDAFENIPYISPEELKKIDFNNGDDRFSKAISSMSLEPVIEENDLKSLSRDEGKEILKATFETNADLQISKINVKILEPDIDGATLYEPSLMEPAPGSKEIDDKEITKLFLQQWNLHKGLCVKGDSLTQGKQILTEDGKISHAEASEKVSFYQCDIDTPFRELKKSGISSMMNKDLYEINIRMHIPLLEISYSGSNIMEDFIKILKRALEKSDVDEARKSVRDIFDEYGDYIAKNVIVGGALSIKINNIRNSQTTLSNLDILRTHFYWVKEHLQYGKPNVFDQVSLNHISELVDSNDRAEIISTGQELTRWMKDFYEHKKSYIISYKEIDTTFSLLENDIKQQIITLFGIQPEIPHIGIIIPHVLNAGEYENIEQWTGYSYFNNLSHWVDELLLCHGLKIELMKIGFGSDKIVEFRKLPKFELLNNKYMSLKKLSTKKEEFLITNCIKVGSYDLEKYPFLDKKTPNGIFQPSFDETTFVSEIYCKIVTEKVKLTLRDVKPSELLLDSVDKALLSNYPYMELKKVFDEFGHFLPQSIILGGAFSRQCIYDEVEKEFSDDAKKEFPDEVIKFDEKEIIMQTLSDWGVKFKNLDTSFFLTSKGEAVRKEEIYSWMQKFDYSEEYADNEFSDYFQEYTDSEINDHSKKYVKIITVEDLIPLYKILPEKMRNAIDKIMEDKQHIVMTGTTPISNENKTQINIKFVQPLHDCDYEIFGNLVSQDGSLIINDEVMIRFDLKNQFCCVAFIHNLPTGSRINWIVLAKGHGYFNRHTRDIKFIRGEIQLSLSEKPNEVDIPIDSDLSCKRILTINFDSKYLEEDEIILSKDFEEVCDDLNLSMAIYSMEEREQEEYAIREDIDIIDKSIGELKGDMKSVIKELSILSSNMEKLSTQTRKSRTGIDVGSTNSTIDSAVDLYRVLRIEYSDLKEPKDMKDNVRGEDAAKANNLFKQA